MVPSAPRIVRLLKNVLCYNRYSRWLSLSISKPCKELATVSASDHSAKHMQRADTVRERVHDTDTSTVKKWCTFPHCQPPTVDVRWLVTMSHECFDLENCVRTDFYEWKSLIVSKFGTAVTLYFCSKIVFSLLCCCCVFPTVHCRFRPLEGRDHRQYLYASELGWGGDWQTSSVGELSAVPLNQERGHTHKERRVSTDRKREMRKNWQILGNEKVIKGCERWRGKKRVKKQGTKM